MRASSIPDINQDQLKALSIAPDQTSHVMEIPGYPAEVRAVMLGEDVDYFEIYDTETGECLNLGDPIDDWPETGDGKNLIHAMLVSHFGEPAAKVNIDRRSPSSGPSL